MRHTWIIYAIGFTAQGLFSARLIMQWVASEKNKKVVTPSSFWVHSLLASFLLFIYGYLRNDFSIMLGQIVTYYIYIRNLQFIGIWYKIYRAGRLFLLFFPIFIVIYFYHNNVYDLHNLFAKENIPRWLLILGIVAQIVFTFRFILQWLHAEKIRQAVLPLHFWWVSLAGSGMILTYAIFRKDPVLFIAQLFGLVIYARNIIITRKN